MVDIEKIKARLRELYGLSWYDRASAFLLGLIFGVMFVGLVTKLLAPSVPEAVQKLHDAVHGYMNAVEAERVTPGASLK